MAVAQHEATSADGTKVPYFVVTPKGFVADGKAPTVLYGYGGFEVAMQPTYSATGGSSWLERGGVWVLANIRGGGAYGDAWHRAANLENKKVTIDDFAACARHVVERQYTSADRLAIEGGSAEIGRAHV